MDPHEVKLARCPVCGMAGPSVAHLMGHYGRGRPKNYSPEELERRRQRMEVINQRRRARAAAKKAAHSVP